MAVKLSPVFNEQQFDANGNPLSGGFIYTYAAGSSTPQTSYTNSDGDTAQSNPIELNSRGEPDNPIWLTAGLNYKFVLTDSDDVVIRTVDDVSGVNDSSVALSQWVESGVTPTYVNSTQFTVPGDQTSLFQVNRRAKFTVTAGTVYGYISVSAYTSLTTVTVVLDSGTLDSGLSSVELGLITPNNTSLPKIDDFVTTAMIEDDSVTNAKLNADAKFGRLINRRVITASETGTAYTAGAKQAKVIVVGGGGGGGGSNNNDARVGGGGASGGYAEKFFTIAAATYDVTIGAAGTAGTATGNGGNGGTSSFTDGTETLTCTGGTGGQSNNLGGSPGTATGGDININGQGGGRGGAHTVSIANGFGANSILGLGGTPQLDSVPFAATGYGSGGGGGHRNTTTSRAGGVGMQGVCILEEYA